MPAKLFGSAHSYFLTQMGKIVLAIVLSDTTAPSRYEE